MICKFSPILCVLFPFHSSEHERVFKMMELLGITDSKAFKSQAMSLNMEGGLWFSSCNTVVWAQLSISVASGSTDAAFGFSGRGLNAACPPRS